MKISREDLSEWRKRELARKEMEKDLHRDLSLKTHELDVQDALDKNMNPYVLAAINFFVTLGISYFLYFALMIGLTLFGITLLLGEFVTYLSMGLQIAIWAISVISVFRKRSLLNEMFDFYTRHF